MYLLTNTRRLDCVSNILPHGLWRGANDPLRLAANDPLRLAANRESLFHAFVICSESLPAVAQLSPGSFHRGVHPRSLNSRNGPPHCKSSSIKLQDGTLKSSIRFSKRGSGFSRIAEGSMNSRNAFLCLIACSLAICASGKRELTQVPAFQNTGINVVNSDDASARQQSPPTPTPTLASSDGLQGPAPAQNGASQPPAGSLPVISAPTPATTAQTPPAVAPSQPPLPVVQAPAPAPLTPPLPTVQAPVPAPYVAPPTQLPTVPAPAPATQMPVPVPAPQSVLPSFVPVPAPVPAPAPAPVPSSIPECGIRPQCRLFIEDMLCCDEIGALTNKQHAVMRLQCTHPVNYYPKCFNVTGPSNITTFQQFETTVWSPTHVAQVAFLEEFVGNVTIDIEGPRTNATLSADCGLYVSPCLYEGELIKTVLPVQGLSFSTIPSDDFVTATYSANEDVTNLDSLVMTNLTSPSMCQQQNMDNMDAEFFAQDWLTYNSGFQSMCNATVFEDTMASLAPEFANPPSSGVQTSSITG